jgi:hypothetical protein
LFVSGSGKITRSTPQSMGIPYLWKVSSQAEWRTHKFAERAHRRAQVAERRSIAHERENAVAQKPNAAEREHYTHAKRRERVYPLLD